MLERLEMISEEKCYLDLDGHIIDKKQIVRKPNNDEIVEKINEIIEYINAKEIGN